MAIGERAYAETLLEDYAATMRKINTPKSRRPVALAGAQFSTTLMTCIGSRAGDVRYLVCIERVA